MSLPEQLKLITPKRTSKLRYSRKKVPCAHIADYYESEWRKGPSIGTNLLRRGYRQLAEGRAIVSVDGIPENNLYGSK